MKFRSSGFTLIELVVVIVILGVLAVAAAPKFINLQLDAKNAALNGMAGELKSALALSYAKLVIGGVENKFVSGAEVPIDGCDNCYFMYGYPSMNFGTFEVIMQGFGQDKDWYYAVNFGGPPLLLITSIDNITYNGNGSPILLKNNCYIGYTPSLQNSQGVISPYNIEVFDCE